MKNNQIYMILTNGFDPDVRVFKEAKYLVNTGYKVTILCWDRKGDYVDRLNEKIDGVELNRFNISSIPGTGMKQLLPFFKYILQVKKYLKDKENCFLYCHDFDGILAGYLATLFKDNKYIFDMHEMYSSKYKFLVKFFVNKAKNVIYVNDEQLKFLGIQDDKKCIHIPNYPEEKQYLPIEKEKISKTRVNYIGFLRDYDALKNLINVANINNNVEIGLYGTGECYQKLKDDNKSENVHLYGKFDGINEVSKIYRNTDILYCMYNPSIYNWKTAYPVKLYEALITKTPIIVSKDTKAGDFVEENNIGKAIEYNNLEDLNNAILEITKKYDEYVDNLEKIRNNYKWEHIIKRLSKILEN